MNFEQLFKLIKKNRPRLKNVRHARILLKHFWEMWKIKKRRLKLGDVGYDFIEIAMFDLIIDIKFEMRFIRQDTRDEDKIKPASRLKEMEWKWDFSNIAAFIIVSSISFFIFEDYVYSLYCENLPTLAFKEEKYNELVRKGLNLILMSNPNIPNESIWMMIIRVNNYIFFEALINFAVVFDMFF